MHPTRVRPLATPAVLQPRPKLENPAQPRPVIADKGDGITGSKPSLPTPPPAAAPRSPVASFRVMPGVGLVQTTRAAATAASTTQTTDLPDDVAALTKSDPEGFKKAYLAALDLGEPWATALQDKAEANDAALQDRLHDRFDDRDEGKGGPGFDPRYNSMLGQLRANGEPWVLALDAGQAQQAAQANADTVKKLSNTSFDSAAPEVGGGTAADGSMQVPSPPESNLVNGYVRTNPVVQQLREQGLANLYNPLYAKMMAAAMSAAGPQAAPPQGQGYLAVTDHGFALCYDPSRSDDENKKLAELSLKSGMSFNEVHEARVGGAHGDGKFDDALAEFDKFDPTKPGDLKIALDKNADGNWQIVLHSDGNGFVTSAHEHQRTTWSNIGDVTGEIGLAVAAAAATYFTGGTAAAWVGEVLSVAASVKSTYDAVQSGNGLGVVLGMLGGLGSVAGLAGALGAAAEVADTAETLKDVTSIIGGIKGVVGSIQNKNILGAIEGVAGVVGSAAGMLGSDGEELPNVFDKISSVADKVGLAAAFGQEGLAALQRGDYLAALGAAIDTLQATGALDGIDPDTLTRIEGAVGALSAAEAAVQQGDPAGAVEAVLKGVQGTVDGADGSDLLAGGVALSGLVSAIAQKDPSKAKDVLSYFLDKLGVKLNDLEDSGSPLLADLKAMFDKLGGAENLFSAAGALASAVKSGDTGEIIDQATGLVQQLTQDGRVAAARDVLAAGRQLVAAIKSKDFSAITLAGQALSNAISGAVGTFGQAPPVDGPVGEALSGPPVPQSPDEIKAELEAAQASPDPAEAAAAVTGRYTIRQGDTLSSIAKDLLGDANLWPELYWANRDVLSDPNRILTGQTLVLPDKNFRLSDDARSELFATAATLPKGTPPAPPGDVSSPQVQALLGTLPDFSTRVQQTTDLVQKLHDARRIDDATFKAAMNKLAEAKQALGAATEYLRRGDVEHASTSLGIIDGDLSAAGQLASDSGGLSPDTADHARKESQTALDNLDAISKDVMDSFHLIPPDFAAALEQARSDARQLRNLADADGTTLGDVQTLSLKLSREVSDLRAAVNGSLDFDAKAAQVAASALGPIQTACDLTMTLLPSAGGPMGELIGGLYKGARSGIDAYLKSGDFSNALFVGLRDAAIDLGGAVAGLGPLAVSKKLEALSPAAKGYFENVVRDTVRAAGDAMVKLNEDVERIQKDPALSAQQKSDRIHAAIATRLGTVLAQGLASAKGQAIAGALPASTSATLRDAAQGVVNELYKRLLAAATDVEAPTTP